MRSIISGAVNDIAVGRIYSLLSRDSVFRMLKTMNTTYILESVNNNKFPYRLSIRKGDDILLALRVQDRWPGQKGNVFCIREEGDGWDQPVSEVEKVPVISLKRYGKRLAVVLDRPKNKRCDFLFLTKKYKTRDGEYEQIFWRTQKALKERRPRVKLTTYHKGELNITIDINEKYAWKFPECFVEKGRLPAGDYALRDHEGLLAVVERKTFENLMSEFGRMPVFHQQLGELSAYRHSALVVEADYSDFLNPGRQRFYSPAFTAKAIGELYALHPSMTIVFAGNRKLANEWAYRFFEAVNAHEGDTPHDKIAEVIEQYGAQPETKGGIYYDIRKTIIEDFPPEFTDSMIKEFFPDASESVVKKSLNSLKSEGIIISYGRGRKRRLINTNKMVPLKNAD